MAEYGVQTWDASGKVNNYGIKPVSVSGTLQLAVNQKTGSYSVPLPPGCKLTYFQIMNDDQWGTGRRKVTISGVPQLFRRPVILTTQLERSPRLRLI
jgi:hypothetical protein